MGECLTMSGRKRDRLTELSKVSKALSARFAAAALEPEDAHRRPAADLDL